MRFFFDTNILFTSRNLDFPMATNQEFWNWLVSLGEDGTVKIPEEVYKEITYGDDDISRWAKDNKDAFWVSSLEAVHSIQTVLNTYKRNMDETTIERLKADPWVIAHAHSMPQAATVVTYEKPRNRDNPLKKKIPNVCEELDIPCIRLPRFIWMMKD